MDEEDRLQEGSSTTVQPSCHRVASTAPAAVKHYVATQLRSDRPAMPPTPCRTGTIATSLPLASSLLQAPVCTRIPCRPSTAPGAPGPPPSTRPSTVTSKPSPPSTTSASLPSMEPGAQWSARPPRLTSAAGATKEVSLVSDATPCGTERLLAFSCRRRGLCPSCAARTAALSAAHLVEAVLLPLPHRQVVLTIPKRLRIYFRFDRRLLADLARAAARAITDVVRVVTDRPDGAPGIILALQTFNQDLTHNPHVHALATEGLVCSDDTFLPVPTIDAPLLEHAFRRRVFNLLLRHHKITPAVVDAMHSWKHSGFSAHTAVRVIFDYTKEVQPGWMRKSGIS